MKYLTRDNITLVLSLIGSVGTITTWIVSYVKSRKNISIQIIKLTKPKNYLIIYAMLNNRSRLPITVESLSVIICDKKYTCSLLPKKVFETSTKTGNIVKDHKEYYTLPFPINIPSLSGMSGYFLFDLPEEASQKLSTPLTMLIHSNRGKALEKKLSFEHEANWEEMF